MSLVATHSGTSLRNHAHPCLLALSFNPVLPLHLHLPSLTSISHPKSFLRLPPNSIADCGPPSLRSLFKTALSVRCAYATLCSGCPSLYSQASPKTRCTSFQRAKGINIYVAFAARLLPLEFARFRLIPKEGISFGSLASILTKL